MSSTPHRVPTVSDIVALFRQYHELPDGDFNDKVIPIIDNVRVWYGLNSWIVSSICLSSNGPLRKSLIRLHGIDGSNTGKNRDVTFNMLNTHERRMLYNACCSICRIPKFYYNG